MSDNGQLPGCSVVVCCWNGVSSELETVQKRGRLIDVDVLGKNSKSRVGEMLAASGIWTWEDLSQSRGLCMRLRRVGKITWEKFAGHAIAHGVVLPPYSVAKSAECYCGYEWNGSHHVLTRQCGICKRYGIKREVEHHY